MPILNHLWRFDGYIRAVFDMKNAALVSLIMFLESILCMLAVFIEACQAVIASRIIFHRSQSPIGVPDSDSVS